MTLYPYIGSVINLGNSFSQATRPKHVGQLSDLIQEFRDSDYKHDVQGWELFYNDKIGEDAIKIASSKIWDYVQRIKSNLDYLTEDDVYNWTKDLIIDKTFTGLQIQLDVLKLASNGDYYRLATSQEESKGIDGFIGDEAVSIKPHTYKSTIQSTKENIEYRIIYYKNSKNGVLIV